MKQHQRTSATFGPDRLLLLGVGASAGGLEALQTLLATLRSSDNLAMVFIQHLDPDHESLLPELLSKRTRLPVAQITDGDEVQPGHVYLIPPAFGVNVRDRTLLLEPFDNPRGLRRPIDTFFEALAREQGPNAAAIVLSGTGSDGSQGVRAIKEAGGLVLAQDPSEAKYDGMPRAAIATGAVDMVLRAGDMMGVLGDFHDRATGIAPAIESDAEFLEKVTRNLRYRTGHDFSGYKSGTLLRRITLRMSVLGTASPPDYLRALITDQTEAQRLFRDLLINVTSFFRDPAAFQALRETVVRELLAGKGRDEEVRVWVPGCSTGQEAYSVAMLFADEMSRLDTHPRVAIFGTDIDDEALAVARRGEYPNSIATEIPHDLLESYFKASASGFEVKPELRDMVRFSHQSIVRDPPYSKLDLVTCRNVLIYFDQPLQSLALRVFHYAISPGGWLMLGPSESVRLEDEGFKEVSADRRIFRRDDSTPRPLELPRAFRRDREPPPPETLLAAPALPFPAAAALALIGRHVPPFVLIGTTEQVLHVGAGAEAFLRIPTGAISVGIRDLVLPPLQAPLKRLLTTLALDRASYREIALEDGGGGLPARLVLGAEVLPDGGRIVTFTTLEEASGGRRDGTRIVLDEDYVKRLEDELDEARQTVRHTVEELETSNEELKSSNEEMMSMNEELQSANEELTTTNEELQNKVRELAELNADLANFMESTQIATIFLDSGMRLRNFTPDAIAWFRFAEQDRGREIMDIGSRLPMDRIVTICRRVMGSGVAEEVTFATSDGTSEALLRFAPYRAESGRQGGIVFSVFDVTAVTRYARAAEAASAEARARAAEIEELYRVSPGAMGMVDRDLRYLRVNPKLAEVNGIPAESHMGRSIAELVPDLAPQATTAIRRVFETGDPILGDRIRGHTREEPPQERVWEVDWYPVHSGEELVAVGFNVTDITSLLELQADLRRIMRELQHRVKNMLSNVLALVNRARREEGDPRIILETLSQRIRALANTHNLLTAENWSSTSIRDILALELTEVYGAERVTLRGPDVRLNARATLALSLSLHELATNASKYGSLSAPEGQVAVRWLRLDEGEGDKFVLRWEETGGPEVSKPTHEGFGSQLIQSMIEGSFEGRIIRSWEPAGFRAVLELPWYAATNVDYDSDADPLQHADPLS
jgi:two-component system, chemotaxis family, CheB/CheR fusion protein